MTAFIALRTWLDRLCDTAAWLVLPLALLLFAQWPLRDLAGAGSRQANDIAQWVFALYVAVALRHATRRVAHLRAPALIALSKTARARIERWGHSIAVLPFCLFVLVSGAPMTWHSLRAMESFPDTFNPGYFLIKCAAWLLALLMAVQALVELGVAPAESTHP